MPERPLVRLNVADAEDALVAVDRDAADDLAEGERHDRDVVAAQAQRREAEDRAERARRGARRSAGSAASSGGCPGWDCELLGDADVDVLASAKQLEPNQPIVYAPIAKNAT